MNKGIVFLKDVIHQGSCVSPAEIKARHNLTGTETFEYISVCKCIQSNRQLMGYVQAAGINCVIPETKASLACENSKSIYTKLKKKLIERPTSEIRLNSLYSIDPDKIENIYKLPFLVTIETKMRSFQFKFNHLIFYTNKMLYDRKITSDPPHCTFCKKEDETLDHLFIDCTSVQPLWTELERLISHKFSRQEKIFGCYDHINNKHFDVISHCSILLRYYVHICRLNNQPPNTALLIKRILYTSDLELRIATKKNKTDRHHKKWSPLTETL